MPETIDPVEEVAGDVGKSPAEVAAAEALKIAKELQEKLGKSEESAPEPIDIDPATLINSPDFKAKAKEATGMTDQQIDFVIKTVGVATAGANETAAVAQVKANHPGDFSKFEKAIKEELKGYPPDKRGNAAIIEKLYYVEKGKEAEKGGSKGGNQRPPVRTNSGPTGSGLERGSRGDNGSEALDDEERFVARKMGIKDVDYAKAKTTKLINDLIE